MGGAAFRPVPARGRGGPPLRIVTAKDGQLGVEACVLAVICQEIACVHGVIRQLYTLIMSHGHELGVKANKDVNNYSAIGAL